jgi:ubiquitin-conjugating enzyme E2 G2
MLAEPNDESAANVSAAKMWREDRAQFERIADRLVRKTLGLPTQQPPIDQTNNTSRI